MPLYMQFNINAALVTLVGNRFYHFGINASFAMKPSRSIDLVGVGGNIVPGNQMASPSTAVWTLAAVKASYCTSCELPGSVVSIWVLPLSSSC